MDMGDEYIGRLVSESVTRAERLMSRGAAGCGRHDMVSSLT